MEQKRTDGRNDRSKCDEKSGNRPSRHIIRRHRICDVLSLFCSSYVCVRGVVLYEVCYIKRHLFDLSVVELFDFSHRAHVVGGDEVDRNSLTTETT